MGWWSGSSKGGWSSAGRVVLLMFCIVRVAWAATDDAERWRAVAADSRAPSAAAQALASWAVSSGDHQNFSFVVVDKLAAILYVFDGDGTPRASSSVLLGLALGDRDVPGIGARRIADIKPEERNTPAGRFVGERGKNIEGENIVWIDYDAGLAIHRLRPGPGYQQRLRRLASTSPADKRVSYGCVVVPVEFFEQVIAPTFAQRKVIVYILPETSAAPRLVDLVQQ